MIGCCAVVAAIALLPARAPPRTAAVRACALPTAEFSRPHRIDPKRKFERVQIAAVPAECEALCRRFELEGLGGLEANVSLSAVVRQQKVRVRASGSMTGRGVRRKSFSGESVEVSVEEVEFEAYFAEDADDDDDGSLGGEIDMSDETLFDEPLDDGAIDLVRAAPPCPLLRRCSLTRSRPPRVQGELVAQHLYMHLTDLTLLEADTWATEDAPGTIYYDSDPNGDADDELEDSGGTIGDRLGW